MKRKILDFCMKSIKNKFPDYDNDKLEIIEYGLEGLYLTFTKLIIIACLSIILGKLKNVLLLLILFNIIRFSSFGLHANKSSHCLLISTILFIGGVYICDYIYLPLIVKTIISINNKKFDSIEEMLNIINELDEREKEIFEDDTDGGMW